MLKLNDRTFIVLCSTDEVEYLCTEMHCQNLLNKQILRQSNSVFDTLICL